MMVIKRRKVNFQALVIGIHTNGLPQWIFLPVVIPNALSLYLDICNISSHLFRNTFELLRGRNRNNTGDSSEIEFPFPVIIRGT